jgi:hypothetical protein
MKSPALTPGLRRPVLAKAREDFASYLDQSGRHHFFVSGVEDLSLPDEATIASEEEAAASDAPA